MELCFTVSLPTFCLFFLPTKKNEKAFLSSTKPLKKTWVWSRCDDSQYVCTGKELTAKEPEQLWFTLREAYRQARSENTVCRDSKVSRQTGLTRSKRAEQDTKLTSPTVQVPEMALTTSRSLHTGLWLTVTFQVHVSSWCDWSHWTRRTTPFCWAVTLRLCSRLSDTERSWCERSASGSCYWTSDLVLRVVFCLTVPQKNLVRLLFLWDFCVLSWEKKSFFVFLCGQNKPTKSWKQNRENKAPLQDLCIIFHQEFWKKRKIVIIFMLRSHFRRLPGVFNSWDLFSSKEQPRIRFIQCFFFINNNVRTCFLIDF